MKKILSILLLILSTNLSFAQKEGNVWMFGDSAGISFNTIPPHALLNGLAYTGEASSSICDKEGNLLFYAGAKNPVINSYINIWNQNNQIILNGTNLAGLSTITQGALLIPEPQNDSIIFLFHIDVTGLYYSKINKKGDSGNGEVINKNTLLLQTDSITEKLIAVRHANGRDWWIMAHLSGNNTFIKYILQKDTILGPYEQAIGSIHTQFPYSGSQGQMCISKNGDKLACVTFNGIVDIYDFDRCSGEITNCKKIGDNFSEFYGCCFSPNNSKFYVITTNEHQNYYPGLFQFDLNASNIISSKALIFQQNNYLTHFGQMHIGIDNRIYIAKGMGWVNSIVDDSINKYLGVINFPNLSATLCDFDEFGVYLGGKHAYLGLPNIPNYALGKIEGSECDTIPSDTIKPIEPVLEVYPNPAKDELSILFHGYEQMQNLDLEIYNILGELVMSRQVESNREPTNINISQISSGCYILVLKNGSNALYKDRLVIIK